MNEIIIAGFGGQGVMAIGKTLAEAGLKEGKEVSWLPSYGPEMRGGTANCSVILSEEPIICPLITAPTELIVMNTPSLLRFEDSLRPGGVVFVNSSIVDKPVERTDVRVISVPCFEIASELGNGKVSNMVMLGAYIAAMNNLGISTIREMLSEMFTGPKAALVELNLTALRRGAACVQ